MVAPAFYHGLQIKLGPLRTARAAYNPVALLDWFGKPFPEIFRIARFSGQPAVKRLFHQQHAFAVTDIN